MQLGARIQAAIEVLEELERNHRPAGDALRDWGRAHRFAGSGDRAVIGNIVFDALRRRRSVAAWLGDESARAAAIGTVSRDWGMELEALAQACATPHGPGALSDAEREALAAPEPETAEPDVAGDFPAWLLPELQKAFGDDLMAEAAALSGRPAIDLRANTLKASRDKVVKGLARHDAVPAAYAPDGVRIPAPQGHKRYPNMESETGHGRGWFEVQDEGSQIAARIAGAEPGMQVLDFCAGAGGKTLALAAAMGNKGQIHAYDRDRTRLRRIFPRLQRAGVRNCQIVEPGDEARLAALDGRMDLVFVDAPCSGSGTWRRRPDAKWRLSEAALDKRREEQAAVLEESAPKVKPGGRLVYVTCSVLPCENGERIEAFLAAHPEFKLLPAADLWAKQFAAPMPEVPGAPEGAILLTPHRSATDGFYIAVMERADG